MTIWITYESFKKLKLNGAKLTDRVSDIVNVGAKPKAAAAYSWLSR